MVVESAEEFPTATLASMLKLAKRLADAKRGRLIFVFAPSDKLGAIGGLGALSRAKVLNVGDLSREAALTYLTAWGCPEDRARGVYDVTEGHLAVLVDNEGVNLFCGGAIDQPELQTQLLDAVGASARAVDDALGCDLWTCSCEALLSLAANRLGNPTYMRAKAFLVEHHLARASLQRKGLVLDSPLIHQFTEQHCTRKPG